MVVKYSENEKKKKKAEHFLSVFNSLVPDNEEIIS